MAGYTPPSSSWPFTPLSTCLIPNAPDFTFCHPFYGSNLVPDSCIQAAGRLPTGNRPVSYGVRGYRANNGPLNLPIQITEGDGNNACSIVIEAVDPRDTTFLQSMNITPDSLRGIASCIINQCVSTNGQGGFGTISIQSMIDWIASQTTTDQQIQDFSLPGGPGRPGFMTVSVVGQVTPQDTGGGFYDPVIAEALSDGVRQKGNELRAEKLSEQANAMDRTSASGTYGWWNQFTQVQTPDYNSEMQYDCDGGLGALIAVDCSNMVYSGLRPPTDNVLISPGPGTQFVSYRTCNAGITSHVPITLTWAQIRSALSTLIDNCVLHPLLPSRGGRAYAEASHSVPTAKRGQRRKRTTNGLNALPPGVNVTMFYQTFPATRDPDAELRSCTWLAAIGAKGDTDICPPGT